MPLGSQRRAERWKAEGRRKGAVTTTQSICHRGVLEQLEGVEGQISLFEERMSAVARHLAEATYWMLKRKQSYQEPKKTVPESSMA